ncbi:MAG: hypothetical protein K2M94_04635 [Paramuribaculum sp.]|nr:hypothetical protein [Paramuribaculum sp.]
MKFLLQNITIALLLSLFITSCSDEPAEGSVQYYQDIVTFKENANGYVIMTYRNIDDSPLVTLRAEGTLNTKEVARGSRLVCTYTLPQGAVYGSDATINVQSLSLAMTAPLEEADLADIPYTDNGIYVITLYRSGEYINLSCRQEVNKTRRFHITLDTATSGLPVPTVYLTTSTEEPVTAADGQYMASFDLTALWSRTGVEGVKIVVNNTNNKYLKEFTFTKPENL